ncbi:hypothetical protein JVT61DRAFT_5934 [Boletus reticuloceps]|uniref:Uncharacterized protein n=1 Tax=Boletus reticuloceps TaxID=495285 RepID=A0A8I2YK13_9AGAM|nr:hypothetical protein JVT61DRAFT_5934 [Boletus reticuloceps]
MSIAEINLKIQEIFRSESPEIKAEIKGICQCNEENRGGGGKGGNKSDEGTVHDDTVSVSNTDEVESDPSALCSSNIQQCGPALQRVLEHLVKQTGWRFSVLMGGPDPLDPEGRNVITGSSDALESSEFLMWNGSLHTGKTKEGHDFADMYPNFDTEVVDAFGEFLGHVFGTSNSHSMPKNKKTCNPENSEASRVDQQEDGGEVGEVEAREDDDDKQRGKDSENDHCIMQGGGEDINPKDVNTTGNGGGCNSEVDASPHLTSNIYIPSPTLITATPAAHLTASTTPQACLANAAGLHLANPCTHLATSHSAVSDSESSSSFGLATFLTTNPSTPSTVNIATMATLPGVQLTDPSSPHVPTPPAHLAISSMLSSPQKGLQNPTPSLTGYLPMPSDPFSTLVPNSFMDFLNADLAMFNAWNTGNPEFLAASSGMTLLDMDMQSGVQSFTPVSMEGTFPTSNPNLNLTGTFRGAAPLSQSGSNFHVIGAVGNYPSNLTAHHVPSLSHLPAPQAVQLPSSPPEPLSDTSSVQPPLDLPPTLPLAPQSVQSLSSPLELLSESDSYSVQLPPVFPTTLPGVVNAPPNQLPTSADNASEATTTLGRSKRRAVPSQRAERDNTIGKENHTPHPPTATAGENAKNKGKRKPDHGESNGGKSTMVASPKK